MNEYDRLHRQAQRYKELYPKGTRILLLHMGDDPRPVEDDMRGTVNLYPPHPVCLVSHRL